MTSFSRRLFAGLRGQRSVAIGTLLVALALGACGTSTSSEVNQAVGEAAHVAHAVTRLSEKAMRSWCPAAVADDGRRLSQTQARECLRRAWNGWLDELRRSGYDPEQGRRGPVSARTARLGGERLVNGEPRARPDARRVWGAQRALQREARGQRPTPATEGNDGAERVSEAQAALGGRVFRIPTETLGPLRDRIEALDRRAEKLGTAPIRLRDTGERDSAGHAFVVLQGTAPVLAGWALAAIVEHRDGAATVRAVSELGARLDPAAFQTAWCEHCGLRRRRNVTFVVVQVVSGELRQVGSGCLRDFLGGHDPERACRQAEYLALARDELKGAENMTRPPEPTVEAFAAHAAHVMSARGFISRERAQRTGEPASADLALRSLQERPEAPDRTDRALARGALRWAQALPTLKDELSQFETDALAVIESRSLNTRRDGGLTCALIAAYRQRHARSKHLARPGQRLGTTVLVERVMPVPSERYGTVHRCELIDADINRLAWWQTRGGPLQPGAVVSLEGTVERHTRFGTAAVTVLSHCTTEILAGPEGVSMLDPVLDL